LTQRGWLWAVSLPLAALAGGGVWLLRNFDPNVQGNPFLPCLFNLLTGLYCPGCGATRAMHALVHFDLAGALGMNALLILSLPILPLLVVRAFRPLPRGLETLVKPVASPWLWFFLLVGFGVLRNLPWPPFSYLAPGGLA
jgi:hypothetical protein